MYVFDQIRVGFVKATCGRLSNRKDGCWINELFRLLPSPRSRST